MLEFLLPSEINSLEVALGSIFFVVSLFITIFIYKIRKFNAFFLGFLFFTLWNFLEVLDEFFMKNLLRELIFNIFGRFVLIAGLVIILFALKKIPKKIYKSTKKSRENLRKTETWTFFFGFLMILFIINFARHSFGLSHFAWHLFLHGGIIIFSFIILIYSLKLNKKAMKYIVFGTLLWIITNSILFLGHIFEKYLWLETNFFTFFGMFFGTIIIIRGFKEFLNG